MLPPLAVTAGQVRRQLERLHQGKAAGPDGISPEVLRTCASHLFNPSQTQEKVLPMWQTFCLVPVPKKSPPPSDPQ